MADGAFHAGNDAPTSVSPAADDVARLYESGNAFRIRFAANTLDELVTQIRTFLRKHAGERQELSDVRVKASDTGARIVGAVLSQVSSYAEWARSLADKGKDNGPSRQHVARFGQVEGVAVTLRDLLLLPKSARIALWLALLARETATPDEEPGKLTAAARRASSQATDIDFDVFFDGEVNPSEAKELEEIHTAASEAHQKLAAWAKRIREAGQTVIVKARPHVDGGGLV